MVFLKLIWSSIDKIILNIMFRPFRKQNLEVNGLKVKSFQCVELQYAI